MSGRSREFAPGLDLESRTAAAESVLCAMSLTHGFARLVLVAGHGVSVVNNPHASALHCGACAGQSGKVNARLLAGQPWQSVDDGKRLVHSPLRLSMCIEAPCEALGHILERHDGVRALFENRWLHLFAIGENGLIANRYAGDLAWEPVTRPVVGSNAPRKATHPFRACGGKRAAVDGRAAAPGSGLAHGRRRRKMAG